MLELPGKRILVILEGVSVYPKNLTFQTHCALLTCTSEYAGFQSIVIHSTVTIVTLHKHNYSLYSETLASNIILKTHTDAHIHAVCVCPVYPLLTPCPLE